MSELERTKHMIICTRRKEVIGRGCGNCGWSRDHGMELKCRNPKSPKADQSVRIEGDECRQWSRDKS